MGRRVPRLTGGKPAGRKLHFTTNSIPSPQKKIPAPRTSSYSRRIALPTSALHYCIFAFLTLVEPFASGNLSWAYSPIINGRTTRTIVNIFIVYAHAEPRSFNGALLQMAQDTLRAAGHSVMVSDLHGMKFDPVSDRRNFTTVKNAGVFKQQIEEMHATEVGGFAPDVEAELRKMEACDLMIWQFPLWWSGLPGILKGWVDRVFAMGRAYGKERRYENGIFKGKRALLSVTTGAPEAVYQKGGPNGDINAILRPVQRGILRFTGWEVLAPNIIYAPVRMADAERQNRLHAWAARLRALESEKPIDVGEY